jgi:hypothetical protein
MMAEVSGFEWMIMDLETRDAYSALRAWDLASLVHFCPVAAFIPGVGLVGVRGEDRQE